MSYVEKYSALINYNGISTNPKYRLALKKSGYGGSSSGLDLTSGTPTMDVDPLQITCEGNITDACPPPAILGSKMDFSFFSNQDQLADFDADFLDVIPYQWQAVVQRGFETDLGGATPDGTKTFNSTHKWWAQSFMVPKKTKSLIFTILWTGSVGASYDISLCTDISGISSYIAGTTYQTLASASTLIVTFNSIADLIPGTIYSLVIKGADGGSGETIKSTAAAPAYLTQLYYRNGFIWYTDSGALAITISGMADYWIGFLQPGSTREWVEYNYKFTLTAIDGLADLKNIDFNNSDVAYTGVDSGLNILKKCLDKTQLLLSFRIQSGLYEILSMTSIENAFKEINFCQEVFYKNNDGTNEYFNCYDVLNEILNTFCCQLKQSDGQWEIINIAERNSYVFILPNDLSTQLRASRNISKDISDYLYQDNGNIYKVSPIKNFNVTYYNKNYNGATIIANPNFTGGISNWNNGPSTYDFILFAAGTGTYINTLETTSISSTVNKYYESDAFYINVSSNTSIWIYIDSILASLTGGSNYPDIRIQLIRVSDGGIIAGLTGLQSSTLCDGVWHNFAEWFSLSGEALGLNQYKIRINVEPTGASSEFTFYWDNVTDSIIRGDYQATDYIIKGNIIDFTGTENFDIIRYFMDFNYSSEEFNILNSAALIEKDSLDLTLQWKRYGESNYHSLYYIQMLNILNNYAKFVNYIKCSLYVPDDDIGQINILEIDSIEYRIIGFVQHPMFGLWELDMIECSNIDQGISADIFHLNTTFGEKPG